MKYQLHAIVLSCSSNWELHISLCSLGNKDFRDTTSKQFLWTCHQKKYFMTWLLIGVHQTSFQRLVMRQHFFTNVFLDPQWLNQRSTLCFLS
jgi:hypothetical protein